MRTIWLRFCFLMYVRPQTLSMAIAFAILAVAGLELFLIPPVWAQERIEDAFARMVREQALKTDTTNEAPAGVNASVRFNSGPLQRVDAADYVYTSMLLRWLERHEKPNRPVLSAVDTDPNAQANIKAQPTGDVFLRVVGEGAAPTGDRFRETVAILQTATISRSDGLSGMCSGTLVSDLTVLTAAHCICGLNLLSAEGRGTARVVYGPFADRSERFRLSGPLKNDFSLVYSSPVDIDLDPALYDGRFCEQMRAGNFLQGADIALLFLKKKDKNAENDNRVDAPRAKAVMASRDLIASPRLVRMTVVGYGISDFVDETGTRWGKVGVVVPIADATCTGAYALANYRCSQGQEAVLVDWHKSRDTCSGDSGGPAFIRYYNAYYLAAVTSRAATGDECGEGGVYTLLTPKKQLWINKNKKFYDPSF